MSPHPTEFRAAPLPAQNHHTSTRALLHLRRPPASTFFRTVHLGSARGGDGGCSLALLQEIMPEDQNGASDEHRRISSNDDTAYQPEGKSIEHLPAKEEQRQGCQQ